MVCTEFKVHVCCYIQSPIERMCTANCTQNKLYFPEDSSGALFILKIFVYFDVKQDQFLFSLWWSIQLCYETICTSYSNHSSVNITFHIAKSFIIDTLYLTHCHSKKNFFFLHAIGSINDRTNSEIYTSLDFEV